MDVEQRAAEAGTWVWVLIRCRHGDYVGSYASLSGAQATALPARWVEQSDGSWLGYLPNGFGASPWVSVHRVQIRP